MAENQNQHVYNQKIGNGPSAEKGDTVLIRYWISQTLGDLNNYKSSLKSGFYEFVLGDGTTHSLVDAYMQNINFENESAVEGMRVGGSADIHINKEYISADDVESNFIKNSDYYIEIFLISVKKKDVQTARTALNEDAYVSMLRQFKRKGFKFSLFHDDADTDKKVYLRHDIDFDIHAAVKMAEIDHQNRIRSTFFVMFNSGYYNILSPEVKDALYKINSLGHTIGIHIDTESVNEKELKIFMTIANSIIDTYFGSIVNKTLISFHKPDIRAIQALNLSDYINVYDDKYFSDILYFSDSGGEWKYGSPLAFLNRGSLEEVCNFQLLIHPVWWIASGSDQHEKLKNTFNANAHRQYSALKNKNEYKYL